MPDPKNPRSITPSKYGQQKAREARDRIGLKVKDIKNETKYSSSTINNFFNGNDPVDKECCRTICELIGISLDEITATLDPYKIPFPGTSHFVGRSDELNTLHQALLYTNEEVAITAVEGMGGVGKTELAIQYARQFKQFYPGGICWIFSREFDVPPQIVAFAESYLNLKIPEGMELPDQLNYCWRNWLPGNVLIVLDDVTVFKEIQPYLPPVEEKRFKKLITTRLKLIGKNIWTLILEVLAPENALKLLVSIVGSETISQAKDLKDAEALCKWLGYLPLGIELVAYYLVERRGYGFAVDFSDMLTRLNDAAKTNQAIKHQSLLKSENLAEPITAQLGAEAAFDLSWKELKEPSRHLGKKLGLCADAPIPRFYIEKYDEKYREMYPEDIARVGEYLEDALVGLMKFHLLNIIDNETYRLHSLIREFFRSKLEKGE